MMFISESEDQAILDVMSVKDHLENNPLLRSQYGDLVGSETWGKKAIITANHCFLLARGTRQKIRGGRHKGTRWTRIYMDDFESELNTITRENREFNSRWIMGAVLPAIDPHRGVVICQGTICHEDSFLARLKEDRNWHTLFYQAGDPDDPQASFLWPERFPVSYLKKEKETYRTQGKLSLWYREYQNVPISLEDRILSPPVWSGTFSDGQLHLDKRESPTDVGVTLSIDLGGEGTYTVFEILGWEFTENGEWIGYELDTIRGHFPEGELVDKLFEAVEKYEVQTVSIEKVALQAFFVTDRIYSEMRRREAFFRLVPHIPKGDKKVRIRGLAPVFRANALFLKPGSPTLEEAEWFDKGKYVDCLDALEQGMHYKAIPTHQQKEIAALPTLRKSDHKQLNWWVL
jgi:hypothetical protein